MVILEKPEVTHAHSSEELARKIYDALPKYASGLESALKTIAEEICCLPAFTGLHDKICVMTFGGPARREMLGESDADILLVRRQSTPQILKFRHVFEQKVRALGFLKVDIPVWGDVSDCEAFISNSITEANQVIEARFVWGCQKLSSEIDQLRSQYATSEKMLETFFFQYWYFDQYYTQRGRPGFFNLKYGHGGTRDLLFPVWLNSALSMQHLYQTPRPSVLAALQQLQGLGVINHDKHDAYVVSSAVVLYLRNFVLKANRGTADEDKTFWKNDTMNRFISQVHRQCITMTSTDVLRHIDNVKSCKEDCFRAAIALKQEQSRGRFIPYFKDIQCGRTIPRSVIERDIILRLAWAWGFNTIDKDDPVLQFCLQESRWSVITSICSNPNTPDFVLDHVARVIGIKRGFEYILKVVARNKNTMEKTLTFIASHSDIEFRFKEPAIVRLERGWKSANQL